MKQNLKHTILEINKKWRALLPEEEKLKSAQFTIVFFLLSIVSFVMSIMNYFTHWQLLMWSTIAFGIGNVINAVLSLSKGPLKMLPRVLFAIEFLALFTFFVIVGEPEGFSAIWCALLPLAGLLLFRIKSGTILSLVEFFMLIFFFWTPVGKQLIYSGYTDAFCMRFPVLYLAFFAIGLFFEFTRWSTHRELIHARDKYKMLYNDETIKAEEEKARHFEIINVLASDYDSVTFVNLNTNSIEPYSISSSDIPERMGVTIDSNISFVNVMRAYIDNVVYADDRENFSDTVKIANLKEELSNKKSFTYVYRVENEGDIRYWEMKIVKMGTEDEEAEKIVLGLADRDAEVRKEQEYQNTLKEARAKAEASSAAKSTFLFNMSHDIRTPLNAIIGFADMANRYKDNPEKVSDCMEKSLVASNHLLSLINDVLDMSRIESGKVVIEETLTEIDVFAEHINTIVAESAKEKNITFTKHISEIKDTHLYIDTLHMDQVLLNVISNAVKYTKSGGNVDFYVEQLGDVKEQCATIRYTIADNGMGMSEEFLKRIFEAFEREQSSTKSGIQGTGLGMAITKRLVDMMNGDIEIRSKVNEGTTVEITMYYHRPSEEELEALKPSVSATDEISLEGKIILLVDDNDLNREIAKDILELDGLIVEEANDGTMAVEMVKAHDPDYYCCVLMDIQMPIMDGYQATIAIRALENADYKKLPIFAMTANAFAEDRKKAFESGMNEHIAKPIDPARVLSTIKNFMR
ncbi:MAG: response regulator [Clostridia bacterium]|nr:response regulator [Clostridia bacterium]